MRTVLIDDEPPARRKLRQLLSTESDVEVVGEAGSGAEAVDALNRLQPELAFLDIQLPDCTGFDVVASLRSRENMHLVFVTAHDDFALQAFEVHAVDYLLKPVEPSRFAKSINRIRDLRQRPFAVQIASRLDELVEAVRATPGHARRILVHEGDRSIFLEVAKIAWIEAARNYACIHSGSATHIVRSSLDALSAKLDPTVFRRINRSEIVNVAHIAEVRSWFHGDQKVVLQNGTELNWSRRYRAVSLEELERA